MFAYNNPINQSTQSTPKKEREELYAEEGVSYHKSDNATEIDDIFTLDERRQTEDLLTQHTVPYQIFLYSGVEHGFATKGDLANGKARFAKEQAFFQAVCWLDGYVKRGA